MEFVFSEMRLVVGIEFSLVRLAMIANILAVGLRAYGNPIKAFRIAGRLVRQYRKMLGGNKLNKAWKVSGKYVWDPYNPHWPSRAFNSFYRNHLHEIEPISQDNTALRRMMVAITKRCPLSCEHCSEGDSLYDKDKLTLDQIVSKLDPFVVQGAAQIQYSGGEPLARFDDLLALVKRYAGICDQWIFTSGFGLTAERTQLLKEAGLNGAAISLDNHDPAEHNKFRGNAKSFEKVVEAIEHCHANGIFITLNVCPTKAYIASGKLQEVVKLAEEMQVPVVSFIEPKAVGRYKNEDVLLNKEEKDVLAALYHKYSFNRKDGGPSITYPEYYKKSQSCGGGRSYLFLDYDGSLKPCPFCKVEVSRVTTGAPVCEADPAMA